MIGVLSDPTAVTIDEKADRKGVRRAAYSACFALTVTFLTTCALFASTSSESRTVSGPPFNLIHRYQRVHWGLIATTSVAFLAALFYPFAVVGKPRPRFLHVAGSYLVLNFFTLCCIVATTWAGCVDNDVIRFPTVFLSMAGTGFCFLLLQLCIKAKVEALQADSLEASQGYHRAMQICFKIMFSPLSAIFGILACIVPMGVVTDWFWADFLLRTTAVFICVFLIVFIAFTCFSIRCMMQCWQLLGIFADDFATRHRLRRLIAIHIFATCAANSTSVLYFGCSAGAVFQWFRVWRLFAAFGLDNLCNMMCAISLSGLSEAICGSRVAVSRPTSTPGQTLPDVVKELEFAGRVARSGAIGVSAYNVMVNDGDEEVDSSTSVFS